MHIIIIIIIIIHVLHVQNKSLTIGTDFLVGPIGMLDKPSRFWKEVALTAEVANGLVFGLGGIVRASAVNSDRALVGMTGVGTRVGRYIGGNHTTTKVLDELNGRVVRQSSVLTEGARGGVLGSRAAAKGEAFPLHLGAIFASWVADGAGLIH